MFLLCLLNSLFHEAEGVRNDLSVELQLFLLAFDALVLLLHLDREEIHHFVVLVDLLVLLSLNVLVVPHFVQSLFQLVKFFLIIFFVLFSVLLKLI